LQKGSEAKMAKITVYLKDPKEQIAIESKPPETYLNIESDKDNIYVYVYKVKITGKRNFWTGARKKDVTIIRKDVFPLSRVIRTTTEGKLGS
jgi:hypothetical protein